MHPLPPQIPGGRAHGQSSPSFTPTTRAESKLYVSSGVDHPLVHPAAGTDVKLTEWTQSPSTCFRVKESHLYPLSWGVALGLVALPKNFPPSSSLQVGEGAFEPVLSSLL